MESIINTLSEHNYSYIKPIGSGANSSSHLVFSNKYQIEFVAKICDFIPDKSEAHSEIAMLMTLSHPNIIKMYDHFNDKIHHYIILEYCQGGDLKTYVNKNGPLPRVLLYQICQQILSALSFCHCHNITHRDIKPSNILMDLQMRPKLADFGLSSLCEKCGDAFKNKEFSGSKPFMAPEILSHNVHDPFKADIWALGVTFFILGTGDLPWKFNSEEEMMQSIVMGFVPTICRVNLDFGFKKIINMMLQYNPNDRYDCDKLLNNSIFQSSNMIIDAKKKLVKTSNTYGNELSLGVSKPISRSRTSLKCCSFPLKSEMLHKINRGSHKFTNQ